MDKPVDGLIYINFISMIAMILHSCSWMEIVTLLSPPTPADLLFKYASFT